MISWFKKYFIPHEGNEHKPHFFRPKATLFFLIILIGVEALFLTQIFIVFDKTKLLGAVLPAVLTSLTNQDRAENNTAPLTENALLDKAAEMKATDMATRGYFSHTTPDGKAPWYFLDQAGYKYSYAGENLAVNFFESKDVADAWMNSPTHRANIVKKEYTEVGIGVASGIYQGRNTVFVAQFFGTPAIPAAKKEIAPKEVVIKKIPEVKQAVVVPSKIVAPVETKVLGESTTAGNGALEDIKVSKVKLFFSKLVSSPREYANYLYIALAILFSLVLILIIAVRAKAKHPMILLRGLSVLVLAFLFWLINSNIFSSQTRTPNDSTANVIEVFSR